MKIAIFSDTYLPTINGVSYAVKNWKDELEDRGHSVTVVCPEPGNSPSNVTLKAFSLPVYKGYYASIYPPRDHDFSQYDAVHINSFFMTGYYGYRMAKKHDIPLVSTVHTPITEYLDYVTESSTLQKIIGGGYRRWEARVLKKSDHRVALSDYMENYIKDVTGGKDVERLSNGVNTSFFEEKSTERFREKYDIEKEKIIGYTGRLSEEKRVEELIEVAEKFDGQVIIGGDGPAREEYEELNEKENVKFLGFLDRGELPEFYSVLDLLIFPSRVENDPLTLLEANACRTPVVGARAAGLKDSIKEGENGYLYSPGDIEDLKDKIDKAYAELDELSNSSRKVARERSIAGTVDKLLELYQRK